MTTVKYLRRKNLGSYEHEELEICLPIESIDKKTIYIEGLEVKQLVLSLLQDKKTETTVKEETNSVAKPVVKEKKEEEVVVVAPTPKEEEIEVQVEMEIPQELNKKEEVVAAVKEKKEKKESKTTKASKASKATTYDRGLETHKTLIARWLDSDFKKWNEAQNLPKFGNASRTLSGNAEFLDESGAILESFKEKFRELVLG